MTCNACKQPILAGQMVNHTQGTPGESWFEHALPHDCVAATVRNCHRIAREVKERAEVVTNVAGASSVMEAIQAEYPKVFVKEEGR